MIIDRMKRLLLPSGLHEDLQAINILIFLLLCVQRMGYGCKYSAAIVAVYKKWMYPP